MYKLTRGEQMIPLLGLIIGIIIGLLLDFRIPAQYSTYVAVAILAAIDSVLGGIVANTENRFKLNIFISGFFGNAILAALLAFVGDKLGIQLYFAAIFAFGVRIFNNFATLRRHYIDERKEEGNEV
jgi:small basic protein